MRRESADLAAEILQPQGLERARVERIGRAAFPQRQQPFVVHDDRDVRHVARLAQRVADHAARAHLAEAAMDDAAGARLVEIVFGPDVAIEIADAGVVEADRRDHSVAVEPVRKPVAAEVVAAGAVAEQRAAQRRRHAAVDLVDLVVEFIRQRAEAGAPGTVSAGQGAGARGGVRHRRPARWTAIDELGVIRRAASISTAGSPEATADRQCTGRPRTENEGGPKPDEGLPEKP